MHRKVLRRLTQATLLLIVLLIPVFDILRYDLLTSRLYIFGQVWSFAPEGEFMSGAGGNPADFLFKGVFPLFLVFLSLPVWGAVLGRLFCGWFCPVGATFEAFDYFKRKLAGLKRFQDAWRNDRNEAVWGDLLGGIFSALFAAFVLMVFGIIFSGFFIAPAEIWRQISSFNLSFLLVSIATGMMALVFGAYLARITFCSYICLFGITMMIPFIVSPISLRIRFKRSMAKLCTNCKSCERACMMGIKPKTQIRKPDLKCINCSECITACEGELGKENGLFYFGFGPEKRPEKPAVKDAPQAS